MTRLVHRAEIPVGRLKPGAIKTEQIRPLGPNLWKPSRIVGLLKGRVEHEREGVKRERISTKKTVVHESR